MDMLRRRRRFTEPEARFFMVQLLGACHYMHTNQVIHRDLKLGNLFLDQDMNVKVGDFGLAALIESPGERKKTICGTPNYIAPEVLFDTANGHSFEVDTWSIGVILYTLVIGKPPFQTKDVKAIYKRIRDNDYDFPADRRVSEEVQTLVQDTLTPNPNERPMLHDILDHKWFTRGTVPSYIPASAHDEAPDFSHITRSQSAQNLARLRRDALLDEDQVAAITTPADDSEAVQSAAVATQSSAPSGGKLKTATSSLAQQEKEFQHAVQPGSPISALLKSARQPLIVGSAPNAPKTKESPLLRKLQAAQKPEQRAAAAENPADRLHGIDEEDEDFAPSVPKGKKERDYEELRKKELESQKARIVAQMVPTGAAPVAHSYGLNIDERENLPPIQKQAAVSKGKERAPSTDDAMPKLNGFEAVAQTLTAAFEAKAQGRVFRDPRDDGSLPDEKVFIVSWVDYCNKYGMGYALTDGSVGVHFNDSTTIVLSPDKQYINFSLLLLTRLANSCWCFSHFDYITSRRQGTAYVRKSHNVEEYPEDLKSKVYLLKHFERYIMDRLYGEYEYTFEDVDRVKGMDFVQKYLRMKHVIVFKMSHDALQVSGSA
jgi:cell cycle serine/threonine-protein kinase CDC5/MSD2